MIKRTITTTRRIPSVVNAAQEEHYNVTKGVKAWSAPVTDNTSVLNSVNFESDKDGTYALRKPLVLKEDSLPINNYLLYDSETRLKFITTSEDSSLYIGTNSFKFIYYDYLGVEYTVTIDTGTKHAFFDFIKAFYKFNNATELTTFTALVDKDVFYTHFNTYIINPNLGYTTVYRVFNVIKDVDTDEWVLKMVYPEPNTFTTALDVENAEGLEVNMLLDNPYAIRDLYNYGTNSTTKIVAYRLKEGQSYAASDKVCVLTEGESKYRYLVEADSTVSQPDTILKAFITTTNDDSDYWCCWERSSNNIDWEVCDNFINKFPNQVQDILVSDITSEEFEKLAAEESLTEAASYLVTKKMVKFTKNYAVNDAIGSRPDVLEFFNGAFKSSYYYRFQIYVNTKHVTPSLTETITKSISKSYFSETDKDTADNKYYLSSDKTIEYAPIKGTVVDTTEDPYTKFDDYGHIILKKNTTEFTTKSGSFVTFKVANDIYKITSLKIRIQKNSDEDQQCTLKYTTETLSGDTPSISEFTNSMSISYNETLTITDLSTTEISIANVGIAAEDATCLIDYISIEYEYDATAKTTTIYLNSSTGAYQVTQGLSTVFTTSLQAERERMFKSKLFFFKEQQFYYNNYSVYISNANSNVVRLMKALTFGYKVTKLLAWRSYVIVFTEHAIYLLAYDSEEDTYTSRTISTYLGVNSIDSETPKVILNSIYFKSGPHVYKIVPNLYASNDDVLNVHILSEDVDYILEDQYVSETFNIGYATAEHYFIFTVISGAKTRCFDYKYIEKIWTVQEYPVKVLDVESTDLDYTYLKIEGTNGYQKSCYFNLNPEFILKSIQLFTTVNIGYTDTSSTSYLSIGGSSALETFIPLQLLNVVYDDASNLYELLPYADYLNNTISDIFTHITNDSSIDVSDDDDILTINNDYTVTFTPIEFYIDFGQKSSNYTLDKQFLESKLLFSTEHIKDQFPISLDILTDGIQRPLHFDVNTDSALWKDLYTDKGTLGTEFQPNNVTYTGIMKQMFVKYSGKGKTIEHIISGKSKFKFNFFSLDSRYRILPNKQ